MRILCTGDLHLGAGAEYGRQPGDRLRDQQQVWRDIVSLAQTRDVDLLLFAGDAFEGPTPTSEHYDAFIRPLEVLHAQSIPMLAISGNGKHDSAMRETNALAIFDGLNMTVSTRPRIIDYVGCTIATLPWVHPGRLIAEHGGDVGRDEINSVTADLLLEAARGLRAQIPEGRPAVLVLHWSVSGAALPNGIPVADLREPVLARDSLCELGFDAVVCGHIHKPQLIATGKLVENGDGSHITDPACRIFYVGSPLPLNFGEAGTKHGVWILDTDADTLEFLEIDSRPLITLNSDLTAVDDVDGALNFGGFTHEDVGDAIVRVTYRATSDQVRAIDHAQIRRQLLDAGAAVVKIQPTIDRADRARVDGIDETIDVHDALIMYIDANAIDGELAEQMRARVTGYLESVVA